MTEEKKKQVMDMVRDSLSTPNCEVVVDNGVREVEPSGIWRRWELSGQQTITITSRIDNSINAFKKFLKNG